MNGPLHADEGGEAPCFAHLIEEGLLDVVTDRLSLEPDRRGELRPEPEVPDVPEVEEAGDRPGRG